MYDITSCVRRRGEGKTKLNTYFIPYFFASRNHGVFPICREEAVRLLRSTRMTRAYSEGAYSSDFAYQRYWSVPPQHLCIMLWSPRVVPRSSMIFLFFCHRESDDWKWYLIWYHFLFFFFKSSQLWSRAVVKTRLCNCLCVWRLRARGAAGVCAVSLVVQLTAGQYFTVVVFDGVVYLSIFHYANSGTLCQPSGVEFFESRPFCAIGSSFSLHQSLASLNTWP